METTSEKSSVIPRVLWPYRVLAAAGFAVLAAVIVYRVLLTNIYFSDSLYNLSLALRSASPDAKYFLESGGTDLLQHLDLPRPEDWHRTLLVILLKYWSILTGATHDTVWMRLPHMCFVLFWLGVSLKLLNNLADEGSPEGVRRHSGVWVVTASAFLCLLTISPWGFSLLQNPYLDDVPSSAAVLFGLICLMRNPASAGRAAVCGILCGLAYLLKDLCVLWAPAVLGGYALYFVVSRPRPPLGKMAACATAFAACSLLMALPRLMWDYHDFGGLFQNGGLHWIRALYFGPPEKSCFYPFALYGDTSYTSAILLRGGVLPVIKRIIEVPLVEATQGMVWLGFAWWWLIPWAISARRRATLGDGARFLLCILAVFVTGFYLFMALGLGDMAPRYWAVPVTLAIAFGVDGLRRLLHRPSFGRLHAVLLAAFIAVAGILQSNPHSTLRDQVSYLITPQEAHAVASRIGPGEVLLGDYFAGGQFYCLEWKTLTVVIMPRDFLALGDEQIARLLSWYPIRHVYFPYSPALFQRLAQWGFVEDQRYGPNMLYVRERALTPATTEALRRGADLEREGKLEEAGEFYAGIVKKAPGNSSVRLALANVLVLQKRVDAAVEQYRSLLASDPQNRDALFNLGAVLTAAGRSPEAAECFTRLLDIDPKDADAHVRLGGILKEQGRTDEAVRHFKAALEVSPSNVPARKALESLGVK